MAKPPSRKPAKKAGLEPLRFAHPFQAPQVDAQKGHAHGTSLIDHIKGKLNRIPSVSGSSTMLLADIIGLKGATDIQTHGSITIHSMGDSGHSANSAQGIVAEAMAKDFDLSHPEKSPAFLFHLGDVIYGPGKDSGYRGEFYEPYVHYPAKIIAIPGNHDGETFPKSDPVSLRAFQDNFCAPTQKVPAIAGSIFRETLNQPGVYWLLRCPFVDIIGLYSNSAENPGFISGAIPGQAQLTWLQKTLTQIAKERKGGTKNALVIATHHPPFTSGGHSPSPEMLQEIDGACAKAGIGPDLFLSGHAHSYQRYTRFVPDANKSEVPYIVAGTGGVGEQAVPAATGATTGDHRFDKSLKCYGYLTVTVSKASIVTQFTQVDDATDKKTVVETVTLDLSTRKVSAK